MLGASEVQGSAGPHLVVGLRLQWIPALSQARGVGWGVTLQPPGPALSLEGKLAMGQMLPACSWHARPLLSSEHVQASKPMTLPEKGRGPQRGWGLLGRAPHKRGSADSYSVPHLLSPAIFKPLFFLGTSWNPI